MTQPISFFAQSPAPLTPTAFGPAQASAARAFHRSLPGYAPTPLRSLDALAHRLGVGGIYVKDESLRFGLNAFKGLGGSYAIARCLAQRLGLPPEEMTYDRLTAPETRAALGQLTFVTATDGNHGRGVAWTAQCLGHKSVVYLPKGSSPERLANIRALGAEAEITPWNYDDTVRYAKAQAEQKGWVLIQDTSWEGYTQIPTHIMTGYTTLALEITEQLGPVRPTHLFLQAGVGAMAGAIAAFFTEFYHDTPPCISIVEPQKANCIFRTAQAKDGALHTVAGDLDTIMAGLACGEPCGVGWEVLSQAASGFFSLPEHVAATGMRVLGAPLPGDPAIISGESGAATMGLVYALLTDPALAPARQQLNLTADSVILCISTEGDTDQKNYRRILWEGAYSSPAT